MAGTHWNLDIPITREFNELYTSFVEYAPETLCEVCGGALSYVEAPLPVRWERGEKVPVPDFVQSCTTIVERHVADAMCAAEPTLIRREVDFEDDPDQGADLVGPWPGHAVALDPSSTFDVDERCEVCGYTTFDEFHGLEERSLGEHVPREPGKGLHVRAADVGDHLFFHPEWTGIFSATDAGRAWVEEQGWSNVQFLEYGDVL